MRVIFLDLDGVIINRQSLMNASGSRAIAAPSCVDALNKIVFSTGAKIVVTGAARFADYKFVADLRERLAMWGIGGDVIGRTPRIRGVWRQFEIKEWLRTEGQRYEVDSFVILDDESDMGEYADRLVHTNHETGLTDSDAERAVWLLENQKGTKEEQGACK